MIPQSIAFTEETNGTVKAGGDSLIIPVTTTGKLSATPEVQWKNDSAPDGVTASYDADKKTLTITAGTNAETGTYTLKLISGDTESDTFNLTVEAITLDKTNGSIKAGSDDALTVTITDMNIPDETIPEMKWLTDGNLAPTGVSTQYAPDKKTFTIKADKTATAGSYMFTITADGVTSETFTLTVETAEQPSVSSKITLGETTGTVKAGGESLNVTVTTEGLTTDPQVQWENVATPTGVQASYADGTLTITADKTAIAGDYTFTLSADGVNSEKFTLTVQAVEQPSVSSKITLGETTGTVKAGGESLTVSVTTEGLTTDPQVRWENTPTDVHATYADGVLTITVDETAVSGEYKFTLSADGVTSETFTLTVETAEQPPVSGKITLDKTTGTVKAGGESLNVSVTTEGLTTDPQVQWENGSAPTGVQASYADGTLTIKADTTATAGNYTFTLSADDVSSEKFTLTIEKQKTSSSHSGGASGSGGGSVGNSTSTTTSTNKPNTTTPTTSDTTDTTTTPPTTSDATDTTTSATSGTVAGFSDVAQNTWYADAVQYVSNHNLMQGMGTESFQPTAHTTRGMIATILYRMENEPETTLSNFQDVPQDAYFAKAVSWGSENSILNGLQDSTFAPNTDITREQLATILYRYAQYKQYDTTGSADLTDFSDAQNTSAYAQTAMQWCVKENLITGNTDNALNPHGSATRAEVAAILMRFHEKLSK